MIILPMGFLVPLRNYHAGQRLNSFFSSVSDSMRPSRAAESSVDVIDECGRVKSTKSPIQKLNESEIEELFQAPKLTVEMTKTSAAVSPIHDDGIIVVQLSMEIENEDIKA
jgi:hypothetical protein